MGAQLRGNGYIPIDFYFFLQSSSICTVQYVFDTDHRVAHVVADNVAA